MRTYLSILLIMASFGLSAQLSFSDQSATLFYQSVNSGAPMGVADMNGDGLDDIIRLDGTTTPVFDYQTAGAFTGFSFPQLNGNQWSMAIADADENGFNDVFTGGAYNTLKLLKANATGDNFALTTISALPIFLQGSNFADIDNDGDLDIFACHDDGLSHAYENDGIGNYTYAPGLINTSSTVPSDNSGNYGTIWTDYDSDGDLDLYISKCRLGVTDPNDGRRLNLLFENDGNGNYTDVAEEVGLLPHGQSWATDFADIDNDGDLDCFVINHDIPSNLYLNDGTNHFTDIIATSGMLSALNTAGSGIQCKFVDFDNDGFVDLLFSSRGNNHLLFKNNGDLTFSNLTADIPTANRIHSFATGDLNNDGFIDFIAGYASGYNGPSNISDKLFINNGNNNHYFNVRLNGQTSNKSGVGARIELYGSWGKQIREIRAGESYGITTSLTAHFGIGAATAIDSLIIRWPSGYIDKLDDIAIDQTILVTEASNCIAEAGFDYEITNQTVEFTDESSLGAISWFWTFGDGNSSTNQNPSHTYTQDGTYLACLFVNGNCGQAQTCRQITTDCTAPTADFISNTNLLTANFTSVITGTASTITWDFGDGNGTTGIGNPSHTYTAPGTYTVCLEIGSDCGSTEVCHDLTVTCLQPAAGFQVQLNNLTLTFTDGSVGSISDWLWDFGDGNTSTEQNPTHTYAAPGTYLVCLTVSSVCGSSQACLPITVNCLLPGVGFQVQINGLFITLVDDSSPEVNQWFWDFGDGNTSFEQNPTHLYDAPGNYTLCLTATSDCGSSQVCLPLTIVCNAPSVGFQTQTSNLTTIFTDNSSPQVNEWLWDFGDGTTSTLQNPTHTFPSPGTYLVCLTGTSACSSTQVCLPITVSCTLPGVGFQVQNAGLTSTFTDNSVLDVTQWLWDFGDGTNSMQENPTHTYAAPGTYTVCLTGTSACGSNQVCLPITVSCAPPAASFEVQVNQNTVSLTNNSSPDATQWLWDFGDGTSSALENPTHNYTAPGNYTICLTSSSVCGSSQLCIGISIDCISPLAAYSFQTDELTVSFVDNSNNLPSTWLWDFGDGTSSNLQNPTHDYQQGNLYTACLTVTNACGSNQICQQIPINCPAPQALFSTQINNYLAVFTDNSVNDPSAWEWNFGDGNTSSLQNPTHAYTQAGTYTVCLTVESPCGENSFCQSLTIVCDIPTAGFSYQNNNLTTSFTDNSTNQPNTWLWTFGDGASSNLQNPSHAYAAPGGYTICLTASNACGNTQTCQQVAITCDAPDTDFSYQNNDLIISFTDNSSNQPTTWLWDFGDGNTSTLQSPSHGFSTPGTYTVCLTASSVCGSNQSCQSVLVDCTAPVAAFGFQSNELSINFNDNSTNQPTIWLWTFGDGITSTEQSPTHIYSTPGTYMVCLTASSICGSNQVCQQITTNCAAPNVGFTIQIAELDITLTNTSSADATQWLWDFGDGASSTEQNPSHSYASPGTYTVCLTATSICGSNQICLPITANCAPPSVSFTAQINQLTLNFTDNSAADVTQWLWDFGDGTNSTEQHPAYTYAAPGTYTICLTAISICGSSQACQSVVINCAAPSVIFEVEENQLTVNFTDNSSPEVTQWFWTFGDGNTSSIQNPSHTYLNAGTYTACLTGTSICGSNQSCQQITINCATTQAAFSIESEELDINLTDNSTNQPNQWSWDFGDGQTSTQQNPNHSYNSPGTYTICLTASNDCGSNQVCQNITVSCMMPEAAFGVSITNLTISLTDNSSNAPIQWMWNFGDGFTSTEQNPTHEYAASGQFTICLSVMNACGFTQLCETITVDCTIPQALFSVNGSELAQAFTDASTNNPDEWFWVFGDGETSTDQSPNHFYEEGGSYNVCLTVTNDCGTSTTCQLIVLTTPTNEPKLDIEVLLSPNPASDKIRLTIKSDIALETQVLILDVHGQQISEGKNWKVAALKDELVLDITNLPAGLYFVFVITEEGRLVKRFLKVG